MSKEDKHIIPDEEDEHHSFSQRDRITSNHKNQFYLQSSKRQNEFLNKLCVTILIVLLVASVTIFVYRYFQLRRTENEHNLIKKETQTNIVTGQSSRHENGQIFESPQIQQNSKENQKDQINKDENTQNGEKTPQLKDKEIQQLVGQEIRAEDQNSKQYKISQELKNQQQEILEQGTVSLPEDQDSQDSLDEQQAQIDKQLDIVGSVEQAQFLNQRNALKKAQQKTFQLKKIKEELELHPKLKNQYKSLFTEDELNDNKQESLPNKQIIDKGVVQDSQDRNRDSEEKIQNSQNQQDSKMDGMESEIKESQPEIQNPKEQLPEEVKLANKQKSREMAKTISSKFITENDMSDPIIRVKEQIERNFNTNFDDVIYIKAGTNITEEQYYKAIERMHLWKFFNPLSEKLEILNDDIDYKGYDLLTPQSTQAVLQKMQRLKLEQKLQYEQKYQVSQYDQIPFCIIVPSYKNQDKYFRNLNSILQQDYKNYHIIYIDDASKDGTAQKVRSYIQKYKIPQQKLNFIQNNVNKKALPNIDYAARRLCNSGEIMAIIDGDDYLIGTQAFKIINARYQMNNLLVLYTNHIRVHQPIYLKVGTCIDYPERVKKLRSFRRFSIFPASHLRTFFVDLYWRINIKDLKDYQGEYFSAANDFAIMMPILQMAGNKYEYFSELTYVYDAGTGLNNFQSKAEKQAKNFKITKRRHKYPKIDHDLEFEKNLRAKGLMKPLPQTNILKKAPPSSAYRLRRNINKL